MLVNYLLLDSNNILIEAPLFDTEINNGEVPDFILNRPDVARIIKDYSGPLYVGSTWDDVNNTLILPESIRNIQSNNSSAVQSVSGGPDVIVE